MKWNKSKPPSHAEWLKILDGVNHARRRRLLEIGAPPAYPRSVVLEAVRLAQKNFHRFGELAAISAIEHVLHKYERSYLEARDYEITVG